MSEIKTIEQDAAEFVDKEMCYRGLKLLVVRQASIKAFIAGAKYQKELSDAREKQSIALLSVCKIAFKKIARHGLGHYEDCAFMEYEEDESLCDCPTKVVSHHLLNALTQVESTLSSVAKKLEGL